MSTYTTPVKNVDIVERVELTSVIVLEENGSIVRRRWADERNDGRTRTEARVDEEEVGLVGTCTPVDHLNTFWTAGGLLRCGDGCDTIGPRR